MRGSEQDNVHLAEMLRTGVWHWKLEIREIAEEVAETLCLGSRAGTSACAALCWNTTKVSTGDL